MKIKIRTSILTNFLAMTLFTASLLLYLQYSSSKELAIGAVKHNMKQVTTSVSASILNINTHVKNSIELATFNANVHLAVNTHDVHPAIGMFKAMMAFIPTAQNIYIAKEDGSLLQLIKLKNAPYLKYMYKDIPQAVWATKTTIIRKDQKEKKISFLDKNLNILSSKTIATSLNVRSREWYKKALASNDIITTDVYNFHANNAKGITFAKRIPNTKSVIAIDITLDKLKVFLKRYNFHQESHIVLYQNNGDKITLSQENLPYTWEHISKFLQESKPKALHTHIHQKKTFLISHSSIDSQLHLAIVIPKEALLAPYLSKIEYSIYITLLFILITIPLIIYLTSRIIQPIRTLMLENEKIIARDFHDVREINTNITEFEELSSSFVSMSKSIQKYQENQEKLLDAVVKIIAKAIDSKSIYTAGHCERVPEIAELLSAVASESNEKEFKHFKLDTPDQLKELHLGAWLHDCGKVTTPEYVVDKATKLETINNRIHEIRTRFEVLLRDAQIIYLKTQINGEDKQIALQELRQTQIQLLDDFSFIATSNIGGEFMSAEKQERVKSIGSYEWIRNFDDRLGLSHVELLRHEGIEEKSLPTVEKLLDDKVEHIVKRENFNYKKYKADGFKEEVPEHLYNYGELYNLCIEKGTLTPEERFKINEHIIMTITMLQELPFPQHLKEVPEYAGTHHETMIGTGYPRKLSKSDLSIPARIMAIADIFEALTASDRPYKKAKTLSESLKIMSFMVKDQHIDGDIFRLFLEKEIYLRYAQKHLKPEQIDEVNIQNYLS